MWCFRGIPAGHNPARRGELTLCGMGILIIVLALGGGAGWHFKITARNKSRPILLRNMTIARPNHTVRKRRTILRHGMWRTRTKTQGIIHDHMFREFPQTDPSRALRNPKAGN